MTRRYRPSKEFEAAIPGIERLQTYALDLTAMRVFKEKYI